MKTLHVISHTHWDREWYLTFQQFRLKLVHLVDGLLEILDNDPGFKYFMLDGQTIVLDDYLFMRPEKEETLRRHVQSGRILVGPWHILPDMFLVGPEAHIRNLLQGARTARRFGLRMPVGYIPDPFGHPGQVPQILRGFNLQAASIWRGIGDQPCEFWWQAPDGSRVFMAHLRESYGNGASLPADDLERFTVQLGEAQAALASHSAATDHLVMFGTDHMEPSPKTSRAIAFADQHLSDTRVLHSTLPAYIEAVLGQQLDRELPVVCGELRDCSRAPMLPGVLSARIWIKQRNAACETLLEKWVEPFSVFADLWAPRSVQKENRLGNPAPLIRQTWRLLMENHPHDSICGCSIDQVHAEMLPRFDQVEQLGEELTRQSLAALSCAVDTTRPDALASIILFNPSDSPRQDIVQVDLSLPEELSAFELVDAEDSIIPHEMAGGTSGEFANLVVDKKGLREMFGNIHEGQVAGMVILKIQVIPSLPTVEINAVVSETGQPDLAAWQRATEEIAALESNPSVSHFHIRARMKKSNRVVFVSPTVPPLGWQTIWVRPTPGEQPSAPTSISPLVRPFLPLAARLAGSPVGSRLLAILAPHDEDKPPFVIENEFFCVTADQRNGTLTIQDKRTSLTYSGLNRFVDGGDSGDEYNYCPPAHDSLVEAMFTSCRVNNKSLVKTLEIHYLLRLPARLARDRQQRANDLIETRVTSRIQLAPGLERIDIQTIVENQAEDHRLRVHFPAPFQVETADYDGHFQVVRRPLGIPLKGPDWVEDPRPETHQRAFTDVSNGQAGLMIANRGLPEVEVLKTPSGTETALTLLRCVGWLSRDDLSVRRGHAGPGMETPGAQMMGKWIFEYSMIPHAGDWRTAFQQAYAFSTPLRAFPEQMHPGELPAQGSFVSHTPAEFVLSAVKEAEDGSGWLVRGYNITDSPLEVSLQPLKHCSGATMANLAEESLKPLSIMEDGRVHFQVGPYQVITVRFTG